MSDLMNAIAWELHCPDRGLGFEVYRRFILIEEFLAFGMTNLSTNEFEWAVIYHHSLVGARERAVDLTRRSEEWGCDLTIEPRHILTKEADRRWLRMFGPETAWNDGLDRLFRHAVAGTSLELWEWEASLLAT